jgi:hypothetical protein
MGIIYAGGLIFLAGFLNPPKNSAKVFTMTTPRIYTYKITFEEVPYWYWGVHKERKFGEMYLGSPITHKWMWEFYTPKIQILEFFPYTDEGWKEANLVEKRLIKPDLNNPLCLNENCGGYISLSGCSEGGKIGGKKGAEKTNEEKDENGKSVNAVKGGNKVHEEKDENGKSLHALEMNKKLNEEKDANGKSLAAVKGAEKMNEAKDEDGKSVNAVKGGEKVASQIWESTIDNFRSTASGVAKHNRANGWDPDARIRIS